MNGAEHYREAERLLNGAYVYQPPSDDDILGDITIQVTESAAARIAAAAVHATLAAAAAAAMPTIVNLMGDAAAVTEWGHAVGWEVPDAAEAGEA